MGETRVAAGMFSVVGTTISLGFGGVSDGGDRGGQDLVGFPS